MYHLRSLKRQPSATDHYPFNIPAVQQLHQLDFTAPVTFFVGANGSGKSTLLEAIAVAANAITVGSDDIQRDPTLNPVRALAQTLRLTWTVKTRQGLFAVTGPPAYLPVPAQADGGPKVSIHHRHPLAHYHGLFRRSYLEF
jgi:predicted ATPase